jgi:hypothetical protein
LIRGIIYQLQERAYGGLSLATARKLEHANADPQTKSRLIAFFCSQAGTLLRKQYTATLP